MFRLFPIRSSLTLICLAFIVAACHSASPELRVLGVHSAAREVVFVQVTNPANHPMRLTKLEYTFAADGATVAEGEVPLARELPPGAVAVVEVPLDVDDKRPLTLTGALTAELDQIVRTFQVNAQIQPH
jgi:LEA14-like dessication related protein